jgi:hypothetical protein
LLFRGLRTARIEEEPHDDADAVAERLREMDRCHG